MATRQTCDGCDCDVKDSEAVTVGRYDFVVFCPDCLTAWREYEAAYRRLHAQLVRNFEAAVVALRDETKQGPKADDASVLHARAALDDMTAAPNARRALARLPDDD